MLLAGKIALDIEYFEKVNLKVKNTFFTLND